MSFFFIPLIFYSAGVDTVPQQALGWKWSTVFDRPYLVVFGREPGLLFYWKTDMNMSGEFSVVASRMAGGCVMQGIYG